MKGYVMFVSDTELVFCLQEQSITMLCQTTEFVESLHLTLQTPVIYTEYEVVITEPANGLAPYGARPSAGTVLPTK